MSSNFGGVSEYQSFYNIASAFSEKWQQGIHGEFKECFELIDWDKFCFYSPAVNKPYKDNQFIVQAILWNVKQMIEEFTYTRGFIETPLIDSKDDDAVCGVALIFEGYLTTDGKRWKVEGVDFFRINSEGKATELKVMIRPFSALKALRSEMMRRLKEAGNTLPKEMLSKL